MATAEIKQLEFSDGVDVGAPIQTSTKSTISLKWELSGSISPEKTNQDGLVFFDFDKESNQEIYAFFAIPQNYTTGNQIKIINGLYFCSQNTGKVFIKSITSLINSNTTLGTYSNSHNSVNVEQTVNAISNKANINPDIDLTDSDGKINGVSVAVGDILRIKLFRDNANESISASANARLLDNSFYIDFGG